MRGTSRLFATVKSASKYLEPNTPTGLTGLTTHPSPRPALVYTYNQTLKKLTQLPKSSVYRQSAEALTKHRLEIVASTLPEGYQEWLERVRKQIDASPEAYKKYMNDDGSLASEQVSVDVIENWDGKITKDDARPEGTNDLAQAETKMKAVMTETAEKDHEDKHGVLPSVSDLEVEPPLTREQYVTLRCMRVLLTLCRIDGIEKKIGAGLIEEVIQVADAELELVDEMLKHQVYVVPSFNEGY
jgi:NADH dehydrogenase (ubiquinone) 1 alpha subcomplex subunit 5